MQTNQLPPKEKMQKWFTKALAFDHLVKEQFEKHLDLAAQGDYLDWEQVSQGRLAFVLDDFLTGMLF